jgi:hypothetical protein
MPHLGYAKHDPAGRDGGNSRNGHRPGPCSSTRALVEDAGEQRDERVAFGGPQGVQDVVLNPCQSRVQFLEPLSPGAGQGDQVATPVAGIWGARDVALFCQLIEHCVHVALVDSAPSAYPRLAVRAEFV